MKIVLVTNIYAPYREPVWNALAQEVDELHVILMRESELNRIWEMNDSGKEYFLHVLNSKGRFLGSMFDSEMYFLGGIRRLLNKIKPTYIIIGGYAAGPYIESIIWSKVHRIPLVLWFESHKYSSYFTSGLVAFLRKKISRCADAWCVPGSLSKLYLEDMGIHSARITVAPNTIDVHRLRSIVQQAESSTIARLTQPARILFVGQYIERKRVDLLLESFSNLPQDCAQLRLVGYGPLEDELRNLALSIKGVEFQTATRSFEETTRHYMWADIVVMPSDREVWGLVINEALAAGCYVLSSSLAGVTPDLVNNAPLDVGKSIDPLAGVNIIAETLAIAVGNIAEIRKQRVSIAQWGQSFTPERTADGLFAAVSLIKKCDN